MDLESLRKLCLSFPGTTEQIQWSDDLLFKVAGKMFALTALEPAKVYLCFKASPESFVDLTERPGVIPAPYLARAKWVALESRDAISPTELSELLRASYDLIVSNLPKKVRESLAQPAAKKTSRKKPGTKQQSRKPHPKKTRRK